MENFTERPAFGIDALTSIGHTTWQIKSEMGYLPSSSSGVDFAIILSHES